MVQHVTILVMVTSVSAEKNSLAQHVLSKTNRRQWHQQHPLVLVNLDSLFHRTMRWILYFIGGDACASNPCQNGGTCYRYGNSFVCVCPSAYAGQTCDVVKTTIASMTTTTGISFSHSFNNFHFSCFYLGGMSCANQPCQNGATCYNTASSYFCYCGSNSGFTGPNCDTPKVTSDPSTNLPFLESFIWSNYISQVVHWIVHLVIVYVLVLVKMPMLVCVMALWHPIHVYAIDGARWSALRDREKTKLLFILYLDGNLFLKMIWNKCSM